MAPDTSGLQVGAAKSDPIGKHPAVTLHDTQPQVDMVALRAYRLAQVRAQLRAHDYAGIVLFDPINIRYASGSRNMAVWTMHNAVRYCFVPTEGPVVLFDFHNCEHLSAGLESVAEVRPAISWTYFTAGENLAKRVETWADEIADLVRAHGGGTKRLAADNCDAEGVAALTARGIEITNGQQITELARRLKSPEELACMTASIAVCEAAIAKMRQALEPGMTENQLWAILNQVNAANGGEWIETRLLAAGPRTNPWFQESGDRIIQPGELLSFDTDMVGPYGYCTDISRTFFCGPGRPSGEQRRLYGLAWEQIHANMALLKPGLTFRELSEQAWKMPASCAPNRYSVVVHGVGLCDEYPACYYLEDYDQVGYDGLIEPGMTLCVESYMGEVGGREGVKLEQQVLITETGYELLSTFPFEEELLGREV